MESTTKEKNHNLIRALLLTINGIAIFAGVFVLISLLFPLGINFFRLPIAL